MNGAQPTARTWFIRVAPDEAQIRCSYQRVKKRIVRFTVQLEIWEPDKWAPVVRYDNAHGFCHRTPDGAFVYFQIEGENEFNQYSRQLAERQQREEGVPAVLVRVKGLAPPQGSRLIDPVIEPPAAIA